MPFVSCQQKVLESYFDRGFFQAAVTWTVHGLPQRLHLFFPNLANSMVTPPTVLGGPSSSPARVGRSPAPRPLRLLDLPVSHTSSSSTSPVSSLGPPSTSARTGLGFESEVETLIGSSISEAHGVEDPRPTTVALPSPSPSSLRRAFSGRDASRRQSSISYFIPTRERDDPTPRSPLAGPPLSRSNSVGVRPKSTGSAEALQTRSVRNSLASPASLEKVEERGPLTLAEKCVAHPTSRTL